MAALTGLGGGEGKPPSAGRHQCDPLGGERTGWRRSRALAAHVNTEELPLPASMSVPTHPVSLVSHP